MSFFVRVLVNAVAIWLATLLLGSHFEVVGGETTGERALIFLGVALVFGLVNAVVKPFVALLSLPLYILTLGLFTLVVNALMILLTAWITEQTDWGLRVDGFWWAVLGALVVSLASLFLSLAVPDRAEHR